jgi:hypothetical protein
MYFRVFEKLHIFWTCIFRGGHWKQVSSVLHYGRFCYSAPGCLGYTPSLYKSQGGFCLGWPMCSITWLSTAFIRSCGPAVANNTQIKSKTSAEPGVSQELPAISYMLLIVTLESSLSLSLLPSSSSFAVSLYYLPFHQENTKHTWMLINAWICTSYM